MWIHLRIPIRMYGDYDGSPCFILFFRWRKRKFRRSDFNVVSWERIVRLIIIQWPFCTTLRNLNESVCGCGVRLLSIDLPNIYLPAKKKKKTFFPINITPMLIVGCRYVYLYFIIYKASLILHWLSASDNFWYTATLSQYTSVSEAVDSRNLAWLRSAFDNATQRGFGSCWEQRLSRVPSENRCSMI